MARKLRSSYEVRFRSKSSGASKREEHCWRFRRLPVGCKGRERYGPSSADSNSLREKPVIERASIDLQRIGYKVTAMKSINRAQAPGDRANTRARGLILLWLLGYPIAVFTLVTLFHLQPL